MLHQDLQILPSSNSGLSCLKWLSWVLRKGAACRWVIPVMGRRGGHFVKPLGKALLGRQGMIWAGCLCRAPTGWFDNKMWFGKQISLCLLHPAIPCQTAKCWGYSGASDLTLTCFTHLVLLQLLIKHNICVPEISNKHVPCYGSCSVNMDGSQCFLSRTGLSESEMQIRAKENWKPVCIFITWCSADLS